MNQIDRFQPTRPVSARASQNHQQQPPSNVISETVSILQSPTTSLTPAQWQGQCIQFGAARKAPTDIPKIDAVFAKNAPLTYRLAKVIDGGSVGKLEMYEFSDPARPDAKPQKVFILDKPDLDIATLGSTVPHGSSEELDPALHGFFHFLEHLFFKGSGDGRGGIVFKPGDFDKGVTSTFADTNALTGIDSTRYFIENSPRKDVVDNLKRHLTFIQDPALVPGDVASESQTVCEEIQQALNKIDRRLMYQMMEDMFAPSTYAHPVLGNEASVSAMKPETIRQEFQRFYGQSHRKLVLVGGMDKKAVLETIAQGANLEPQRFEEDYTPPASPPAPQRHEEIRRTVYDQKFPEKKVQVSVNYKGPAFSADNLKEFLAWEMLHAIATGSPTSMADMEMVNRDHAVDRVVSYNWGFQGASVLRMFIQCDVDKAAMAEARLGEILERFKKGAIPAEDFDLARNFMLKQHADMLEVPTDIFDEVVSLANAGLEEQLFGDRFKAALADITPADVQAVAEKYLVPGGKAVYTVLSKAHQPQETSKPQEKAPAVPGPIKFAGRLDPAEKSSRLTGGAELIVDDRPGRSKTSIAIAVPGGNRLTKYPGELRLLTHMLRKSNHAQSVNDLAKYGVINRLDFEVKADNDYLTLQVSGEPEKLDKMVALLRNTLLSPSFQHQALAREKDILLGSYATALAGTPGMEAELENLQGLYPKNHPYSQKIVGSPSLNGPPGLNFTQQVVGNTVDNITPKRLHGLHHQIFQPQRMTVSVVGSINGVENFDLKEHLNDLMANLQKTAPKQPVKLRPAPQPVIPHDLVDVKVRDGELAHTQIVRSWPTTGLKDKDRAALMLLSAILYDVGMTSRLFQTFREGPDGGLCYHTHGIYMPQQEGGRFKWYIGTKHSNVPLVMNLIDQVMNGLIHPETTGKTHEELEEELEVVKGKLKHEYKVGAAKVQAKSMSTALHRALDSPSPVELHEQFDNITLADLQAVAEKYFAKPALTTLLTDRETAEKLGLKANTRLTKSEMLNKDEWQKALAARLSEENPPAPQGGSAAES